MPLPNIAALGREVAQKTRGAVETAQRNNPELIKSGGGAINVAQVARKVATSPTFGHAAKRLAEGVANPYVDRAAKKFAEKYGRRVSLPEKKLTGPGFWMMVMAALLKDLLDLFLNFTVVLSFLVILFGLIISFAIAAYFFMSGVSFTTRKLAVFVASSIIEMLPFISFLPMTTIMLFAVRKIEHGDWAKRAALAHAS
ncbi:MAG: hypothetical protein AAB471_02045 [Patescibacteria group bacterium]